MEFAVCEVGYVHNIGIKVDVCFESEHQLGLEEVMGAGFVVCVEDGRDGMVRDEGAFAVAVRFAHVNAVNSGLGMRGKGELPDPQTQFGGEAIKACKLAVLEDLLQLRLHLYVLQCVRH